jgi:hypothetical protein
VTANTKAVKNKRMSFFFAIHNDAKFSNKQ